MSEAAPLVETHASDSRLGPEVGEGVGTVPSVGDGIRLGVGAGVGVGDGAVLAVSVCVGDGTRVGVGAGIGEGDGAALPVSVCVGVGGAVGVSTSDADVSGMGGGLGVAATSVWPQAASNSTPEAKSKGQRNTVPMNRIIAPPN